MTQFWVMRLVGAALTVGGIALAAFINAEIPDKTLLHLAVMGIAAIVSVIGIGIYEDSAVGAQRPATNGTASANDSAKAYAPPHAAQ